MTYITLHICCFTQDIIAHAGWVVKNFHTFFDYWVCTHESMLKSGRAMYGWPKDKGGNPPKLSSIITSKGKVHAFVDNLLGRHENISVDVKQLLVANALRFYPDFIKLLMDDPTGKYENENDILTKHPFVNRVRIEYVII